MLERLGVHKYLYAQAVLWVNCSVCKRSRVCAEDSAPTNNCVDVIVVSESSRKGRAIASLLGIGERTGALLPKFLKAAQTMLALHPCKGSRDLRCRRRRESVSGAPCLLQAYCPIGPARSRYSVLRHSAAPAPSRRTISVPLGAPSRPSSVT